MTKRITLPLPSIIVLFVLLSIANFASAQDSLKVPTNHWSIGVRFNNPFSISVKKYWDNRSIEFVAGKGNPWKFNGYYYFKHRSQFKNKGYQYNGFDPVHQPLVVQLRYLKSKHLSIIPQLSLYYGLGGQFRAFSYYINYSYENNGHTYHSSGKETSFGVGMDALTGLEFTFRSIPLSIFFDVTLYTEAINRPLFMTCQTSWGMRYNFN